MTPEQAFEKWLRETKPDMIVNPYLLMKMAYLAALKARLSCDLSGVQDN